MPLKDTETGSVACVGVAAEGLGGNLTRFNSVPGPYDNSYVLGAVFIGLAARGYAVHSPIRRWNKRRQTSATTPMLQRYSGQGALGACRIEKGV